MAERVQAVPGRDAEPVLEQGKHLSNKIQEHEQELQLQDLGGLVQIADLSGRCRLLLSTREALDLVLSRLPREAHEVG